MTLLLKQMFAFFKLLNSDTGENQLAAGIACGLIMGFAPAFSLQTLAVFTLLFFLRIQMGAAFLAAFFFKLIAYIFDPLFHQIGVMVLEIEFLRPLYTVLYTMPVIPFTRFYNTVVMGSGLVGFMLAPLLFFVSRTAIVKYRLTVVARFKATKFWKVVQATNFYKWYAKYDQLYGEV